MALKDELELITGEMIAGSTTPTIFRLLKPSPMFDKICTELGIERRENSANNPTVSPDDSGEYFGSGFDFLRWLSGQDEVVTLPGDASGTAKPN